MIANKNGITLMELLAYIAIVGIVVTLLTGTMIYAIRSHDEVNGQGALNMEANYIMSNLMTQANAFNPEYVTSCGTNCIELVIDKERIIDYDTGVLKEIPIDERVQIRIDEATKSIYIGNMKLNRDQYAVEVYQKDANGNYVLDQNGEYIPNIQFECDSEYVDICQTFILKIRLAIYKINDNGEKISKTTVYENRFSF